MRALQLRAFSGYLADFGKLPKVHLPLLVSDEDNLLSLTRIFLAEPLVDNVYCDLCLGAFLTVLPNDIHVMLPFGCLLKEQLAEALPLRLGLQLEGLLLRERLLLLLGSIEYTAV